ncbi:hypothetical protein HS088_TW17G00979 [Tripterygium wilfordii]|uniref:ABC transporter domain-containing protein n=1 Tax=Tripterygium wilfordii TaxID=458696 RepID=A0A7J7CHC4_TRIWF|nr:hypothetical protein HS088_TW17G00979 [Tripterygium wilfordii]
MTDDESLGVLELATVEGSRASASLDRESTKRDDEEEALQWAAIERLPSTKRLRMSIMSDNEGGEDGEAKRVVDLTKLRAIERRVFIDRVLQKVEEDNHRLLQKLKERIDKVGLELPTVEVRYQNLCVEAECEVVHGKPLPSLWNSVKSLFSNLTDITGCKSQVHKIKILKNVSGIVKPSRMTLLLGPPGCGKTTLLQALAGKLHESLKRTGEISYNGYKFDEFVPQKTSAYISQYDQHTSEMTVRETLNFSARFQGIGGRADIMKEISRREKQAGIIPEPDVDTYMKAISLEGLKSTLQTDYILKILGLDICADTIVGDAMRRGISGGQKKRVTTGEMIVGPTRALFMDEISNGLDSSTTFQIVTCLQQLTHITECTTLIALLQPAPETFDLFDDIILMAEGKIVYHGPRNNVLEFFEHCGFRCPSRKGIADFLQEVFSKKDQAQYWYLNQPQNYVTVDNFANMFKEFPVGQKLDEELSMPLNMSKRHKDALVSNIYSVGKWELFKACMTREWLLMKRNSFVHVFKSAQLVVVAAITMTIFLRTWMKIDMVHATYYMGSLFYALIRLMTNGIAELSLTVSRLPVFYKQRDFYFYPAWAYSIPAAILKIPFSFLDAFLWTAITYYVIGYSPEPERFFRQMLLLFLVHQVSVSMFRLIASIIRNPSIASISSLFCLSVMFLFGGFIIPKPSLPVWLAWCFWLSPLSYAEIGSSVNEFLAPRWQKVSSSNTTLGEQILRKRGLYFNDYFYWISIGALLGFWIIFNIGFTCALSYLKPPGSSHKTISHEQLSNRKGSENTSSIIEGKELAPAHLPKSVAETENTGIVLPFRPITITFENVQYFVDTPKLILMKRGGKIIYSGELGRHSNKLIEYFEGIPGVPKIKENYNPATWMLEITSTSAEAQLGLDFAQLYTESYLFQKNEELVRELSVPEPGSIELNFSMRYPQNGLEQFKACLWKQNLSYWRSPRYNLARLIFAMGSSVLFGAILWQKGQKIHDEQDLFNVLGSMFILLQFMGVANCSSVLPFIATERITVYRERFAGMYSSWAYSLAQVTVEIPYVFLQAVLFSAITYPAINFIWSIYKIFKYFYTMFCTLLFFTYFGMLLASLTPTFQVASVFASFFYTLLNLFSGYLIPRPQFPKWWVWGYWICPNAWSLKNLLTSQYGDIDKEVLVYGERKPISTFLKSYYGYDYSDLWIASVVLLAFPLASAFGFAYAIAKVNFQKR